MPYKNKADRKKPAAGSRSEPLTGEASRLACIRLCEKINSARAAMGIPDMAEPATEWTDYTGKPRMIWVAVTKSVVRAGVA